MHDLELAHDAHPHWKPSPHCWGTPYLAQPQGLQRSSLRPHPLGHMLSNKVTPCLKFTGLKMAPSLGSSGICFSKKSAWREVYEGDTPATGGTSALTLNTSGDGTKVLACTVAPWHGSQSSTLSRPPFAPCPSPVLCCDTSRHAVPRQFHSCHLSIISAESETSLVSCPVAPAHRLPGCVSSQLWPSPERFTG